MAMPGSRFRRIVAALMPRFCCCRCCCCCCRHLRGSRTEDAHRHAAHRAGDPRQGRPPEEPPAAVVVGQHAHPLDPAQLDPRQGSHLQEADQKRGHHRHSNRKATPNKWSIRPTYIQVLRGFSRLLGFTPFVEVYSFCWMWNGCCEMIYFSGWAEGRLGVISWNECVPLVKDNRKQCDRFKPHGDIPATRMGVLGVHGAGIWRIAKDRYRIICFQELETSTN